MSRPARCRSGRAVTGDLIARIPTSPPIGPACRRCRVRRARSAASEASGAFPAAAAVLEAAALRGAGEPMGTLRNPGLAVLALLAALTLVAAAQTFPPLTGRVVDEAGVLDPPVRAAIDSDLADLETRTTDQLVVVTVRSLQGLTIEDYGVRLGRQWGIGQKDKNNGALLIVAPKDRKVRIEVGYGLEGVLTDAQTKLIIENTIIPRFRANDMAGGIARGVDEIVRLLDGDAATWQGHAAPARPALFTRLMRGIGGIVSFMP